MKTIYLASDHVGFEYKKEILKHLENSGYKLVDLGPHSSDSTNYALYGKKIGEKVSKDSESMGIAICGSGIGISIAANRYKKVRAARVVSVKWAKLARDHNDANVLALGARATSLKESIKIVDAFLSEPFEGGRHIKRIKTLDE